MVLFVHIRSKSQSCLKDTTLWCFQAKIYDKLMQNSFKYTLSIFINQMFPHEVV